MVSLMFSGFSEAFRYRMAPAAAVAATVTAAAAAWRQGDLAGRILYGHCFFGGFLAGVGVSGPPCILYGWTRHHHTFSETDEKRQEMMVDVLVPVCMWSPTLRYSTLFCGLPRRPYR